MDIHEDYIIQSCTNEIDLHAYKDCFKRNNSPKSIERLKWMHLDNTVKETLVNLAIHKESQEVGGIYAVFPAKYKLGDDVVVGSQSIDTLTDASHRKKGLFKSLANDLYEKCSSANVSFVYGFPNDQSSFAFFNRLEWKDVTEVPFKILLLNTSYIRKILQRKLGVISCLLPIISLNKKKVKLLANQRIYEISSFDDSTFSVWDSYKESFHIGLYQSSEYLNWRIFNKPNETYTVKVLSENENVVGYIIYTVKFKHGGQVGYVMDVIFEKGKK